MREELVITRAGDFLGELQDFCRTHLAGLLAEDRVLAVELVLEELITNALHHGYGGGDGEVRVGLETGAEGVTASVTDTAAPFDTATREGPALDDTEGGRGLALVHSLVDGIAWESTPDGGNRTRCLFATAPATGEGDRDVA